LRLSAATFCQSARVLSKAGDLDMRRHPQNAAAQFVLKAVHHRQHDNQRRHAQRNAQH